MTVHSQSGGRTASAQTRTTRASGEIMELLEPGDLAKMGAPPSRKRVCKQDLKNSPKPADDLARKRTYPHRWTVAEKESLLELIRKHGDHQRQIELDLGTKSIDQIRARVSMMKRTLQRQKDMSEKDTEVL